VLVVHQQRLLLVVQEETQHSSLSHLMAVAEVLLVEIETLTELMVVQEAVPVVAVVGLPLLEMETLLVNHLPVEMVPLL
jgi:hypothetical protein